MIASCYNLQFFCLEVFRMLIVQREKPFVPKYANYDYTKVWQGDTFIGWIKIWFN